MKITFRTEYHGDSDYEPNERHSVLVDGEEVMSQCEWIEPEDVSFARDLGSPHDCESLLNRVIDAVKRGELVGIVHEEEHVPD